jgi:DNA polymerase III sliding clamp (beta) subunit (PCNA family)
MKRSELVESLEIVAPALSKTDMVPTLKHFWFRGDSLMAYNDFIGTSVELKTEFIGAVPATLLQMLKASKAKDTEFDTDGEMLVVKAASSKFKFPTLGKDSFIFDMPKPKSKAVLKVNTEQFLKGIKDCLYSVGDDMLTPDQVGITLLMDGDDLCLFAINGATMTCVRTKCGEVTFKDRVILPADFCRELLRIEDLVKEDLHIEIHDDHVLAVCGDVTLFGKLVESDKPLDFLKVMSDHFPSEMKKKMVPIPTKLELMLDRALIITDGTDDGKTAVTVKRDGADCKMYFSSTSTRGEVHDTVLVGKQHPEVKIVVKAKWLKIGYGRFTDMIVTDKCVAMSGERSLYLVALVGR